jgi:hypothetical protein
MDELDAARAFAWVVERLSSGAFAPADSTIVLFVFTTGTRI